MFYTSIGHMPETFMTPALVGHMLAGVQYALGDLTADATPNPPGAGSVSATASGRAARAGTCVWRSRWVYHAHVLIRMAKQTRRPRGLMRKGALETPSVQSVDRVLTILEAVAKSKAPVPLAQLTDLLGINQSSVFRLANTLKRRGFLANPNTRKSYVLGPSIWRMSRNYDWSGMLISICHDHLEALGQTTGETAHLAVREGRQVLFIDHHASTKQIVVPAQTGALMPLHCTAHGKALLADYGSRSCARCSARRRSRASPSTRSWRCRSSRRRARRSVPTGSRPTRPSISTRCAAWPRRSAIRIARSIAAIGVSAPGLALPQGATGGVRPATSARRPPRSPPACTSSRTERLRPAQPTEAGRRAAPAGQSFLSVAIGSMRAARRAGTDTASAHDVTMTSRLAA